MARFDSTWRPPSASLKESGTAFQDFDEMSRIRAEDDAGMSAWAAALDNDWLLHDQTWLSGVTGREMAPRALLVTHVFNHQTHHRGQVHAMLTAAGETTGATDMPLILGAS